MLFGLVDSLIMLGTDLVLRLLGSVGCLTVRLFGAILCRPPGYLPGSVNLIELLGLAGHFHRVSKYLAVDLI
jgi:hypothetical protein